MNDWPTPAETPAPAAEPAPERHPSTPPAPNRAELATAALFWTAVAAEAKVRAEQARQVLDTQARAELDRDGVAPTWRIPGVGTVPLSLTQPSVEVVDEPAYRAWVARRYPTEIEEILRVRPAFDEQLRKSLVESGDPPCTEEGEVVPGLVYRPGGTPRGLSIRPSSDAKASAAALAVQFLDTRLADVQEVPR